MESGATWDDPSEDLIYELLTDIARGNEQFIIIERPSDASGQTYAQANRGDDGQWLLERRDGSADKHYRAVVRDLRSVHRALTAWAFKLAGWQDSAAWTPVTI